MDRWVITLHACAEPNPHTLEQATVQYLHSHPEGWRVIQTNTWSELRGSSEFLTSLALPDTQVILRLQTSDQIQPNPPSRHDSRHYWIGFCATRQTFQFFNWHPAHDSLAKELLAQGGTLQVRLADQVDTNPFTQVLTLANAYETQTLVAQNHLKTLSRTSLLTQKLLLAISPTRKRFRIASLCVTFLLCLFTWHWGSEWIHQHHLEGQRIAFQQLNERNTQATQPNWPGVHQFLTKFGKDNRANIEAIQLQWNSQGDVQAQVLLNRPRKVLPKGCQVDVTPWILCPVIQAKQAQRSRE